MRVCVCGLNDEIGFIKSPHKLAAFMFCMEIIQVEIVCVANKGVNSNWLLLVRCTKCNVRRKLKKKKTNKKRTGFDQIDKT